MLTATLIGFGLVVIILLIAWRVDKRLKREREEMDED